MLTSIEGGEFLCPLLIQDSRNAVVMLVAILLWIQKVQGSNIVLWALHTRRYLQEATMRLPQIKYYLFLSLLPVTYSLMVLSFYFL